MISSAQIRAARALVGLEQAQLANDAEISRQTLISIEVGGRDNNDPRRMRTIAALRKILEEKYHVEFVNDESGEGVIKRAPKLHREHGVIETS